MTTVVAPDSAELRLGRLFGELRTLHSGGALSAPPINSSATRALLAGRRISDGIAAARRAEVEAGRRALEDALDRILDNAPAVLPGRPAASPRSLWNDPLDGDPYWSPVPVLGFRMWGVGTGLSGAKRRWDSPTYEAGCIIRNRERFDDSVPHTDGSCGRPPCGIYATKKPWSLLDEYFGADVAYGTVQMSGKVVEHDFGYRARRATVVFMALEHKGRVVTAADRGAIVRLFADPAAFRSAQPFADADPWSAAAVERLLIAAAARHPDAQPVGDG